MSQLPEQKKDCPDCGGLATLMTELEDDHIPKLSVYSSPLYYCTHCHTQFDALGNVIRRGQSQGRRTP